MMVGLKIISQPTTRLVSLYMKKIRFFNTLAVGVCLFLYAWPVYQQESYREFIYGDANQEELIFCASKKWTRF